MPLLDSGTVLTVTGMGMSNWSARGLKQQLMPIEQSKRVVRDLNGNAMNLGQAQFQKYDTTISCDDVRTPPFDNRWPGQSVVIECAAYLCRHMYEAAGRDVVDGSEIAEGEYIHYRPILQVLITGFSWLEDEWGRRVGWEITGTEF